MSEFELSPLDLVVPGLFPLRLVTFVAEAVQTAAEAAQGRDRTAVVRKMVALQEDRATGTLSEAEFVRQWQALSRQLEEVSAVASHP